MKVSATDIRKGPKKYTKQHKQVGYELIFRTELYEYKLKEFYVAFFGASMVKWSADLL